MSNYDLNADQNERATQLAQGNGRDELASLLVELLKESSLNVTDDFATALMLVDRDALASMIAANEGFREAEPRGPDMHPSLTQAERNGYVTNYRGVL